MQLIVHLTPGSSQNRVEGWALDAEGRKIMRVKISAVPQKNKANIALIKLLAKVLHIPKARISLIRGATSRTKYLQIELDKEKIEMILEQYLFEHK